jgi:outer membrane protein TolC
MRPLKFSSSVLALVIGLSGALLLPSPTRAQSVNPGSGDSTDIKQETPLSLREAVRIAIDESYSLQEARLDVRNADAQVLGAWGRVYPQINATGSYTRNIKTANPFAGSDVTGLFAGGGAPQWVTFNERARTDDDPSTEPITFQEFQERQREGRQEAGITPGEGGNPFGVDNEFLGGITLRQTLYNAQAFSAIEGAQTLKDLNQKAIDRQRQVVVDEVRVAYYDALLAQRRVNVAKQSVERARETYKEIAQRVSTGTVPKSERLGAKVELANRRTELVQARTSFRSALDGLKQTMGIEADANVRLTTALDAEQRGQYADVSVDEAATRALEKRADLERARLNTELQEVRKNAEQGRYFPTVAAVANLNMSGRVPDDRTVTITNPADPFDFDTRTNDFFQDSYWNPSLNVGLELSWTIFDGFQRQSSIQQQEIAVRRAEVQASQLRQSIRIQVQRALRNLEAARQRIQAQEANLKTARTNYQFAQKRLAQGVTTPLQVREASRQLDQSRLNYLQAVHDYLAAKSAFETAVGQPAGIPADEMFQSTNP